MKRIYNTLFIVGFISLFMSSCNDWLDVRPSDEIKEEYLFWNRKWLPYCSKWYLPETGNVRFVWQQFKLGTD